MGIEVSEGEIGARTELVFGFGGNDVECAAGAACAVQRALRSLEQLHPLQVEERLGLFVTPVYRNAVDVECDAGSAFAGRVDRSDTTNADHIAEARGGYVDGGIDVLQAGH